jgi:Cu+-exporting ATPase
VASGRGAKSGVLFRNAAALERLREVDVLVVDKTGTLTEGTPSVESFECDGDRERTLKLAGALERASEHPLARAIATYADASPDTSVSDFEAIPGKGARAVVDGVPVALGQPALFESIGIELSDFRERASAHESQGRTVALVAVNGAICGLFTIVDALRPDTPATLRSLQDEGVRVVMATGDAEGTAAAVAKELGIREYRARVLPQDKASWVQELKDAGHTVAMAGDGINDAPALASADVGIAMGSGTDVAMESADVVLVRGNLRAVLRARRLSHLTMRNIRQNLLFAFGYNTLGVPVAAGVLYPFAEILLSPMFAAAAMSLSSVSVIGNALRLRGANLE